MNEQQLVKACQQGDSKAQRQLYEQFARKMMGVCLRYSINTEEAEDFLQEGFIKVFEKLQHFEFRGSLEGWIRKVILNTILDKIRRNSIFNVTDSIDDHHDVTGNDNPYDSIGVKELLKMIQTLPTGYRTVFNLFVIEGFSHKEISLMLNISESTSKSQFLRAKEQLQKKIKSEKLV